MVVSPRQIASVTLTIAGERFKTASRIEGAVEALTIAAFGTLEIRCGGAPVKLPTRKDEALLLYLAQTARPHPREQLAEMLWVNRAPAQSLTNLRTSLARLNKQLAPYLIATRESVALNLERPHWFDFSQLDAALRRSQQALAQGGALSSALANELQLALDLYRGEFLAGLFLDSPAFEQWLLTCRETYRNAVSGAHQALVHAYAGRGMYTAALRQAQHLAELDALDEVHHREVMRQYAFLGQSGRALDHYESCRRLLQAELGSAPDEETTALRDQIRAGKLRPPVPTAPSASPLPAPRTPFIGRAVEVAQIARQVIEPGCRLITLVGPGGIGKTRLALEAARAAAAHFADGAVFVSLQSAMTRDDLLYAMANALGFLFLSAEEREAQFIHYLSQRQLLIVLDNLDHLLGEAALLARILSAAPDVAFIATSRERLNLHEEWLFPLEGLPTDDALTLFAISARRVVPAFTLADQAHAAHTICTMVEGMPLAVELAASWVRVMPCAEIIARMRGSLDFLTTSLRNVDARQQSMRALFDQSCALLTPAERSVFFRLAVLRGEWDVRAAETIAGATPGLLIGLVEKSLLRGSSAGRYSLHPLLRQYGWERLAEEGLLDAACQAHFAYFQQLAARALHTFLYERHDDWFHRVRDALENLHAAMNWGLDHGRADEVLGICCGVWYIWFKEGAWSEGYGWFTRSLAATGPDAPSRALALSFTSQFSGLMMLIPAAVAESEEAQRLATERNDRLALMFTTIDATFFHHPYAELQALFEQAIRLSHSVGSPLGEATALFLYGDVAREHGDLERAAELYQCALEVSTAANIVDHIAYVVGNQGRLALHAGDYATARACFERTLDLAREINSPMTLADWLIRLGMAALYEGDLGQAHAHLEDNWRLRRTIGDDIGVADSLCSLADLAVHEGRLDEAQHLLVQSLARLTPLVRTAPFRRNNVLQGMAECLIVIGKLEVARAAPQVALCALLLADMLREQVGFRLEPRIDDAFRSHWARARDQLAPTDVQTIEAAMRSAARLTWQGVEVDLAQIL